MHTRRMVVAVVAFCTLFVSAAAASPGDRDAAPRLAEMTLSASRVDWQPTGTEDRLVLTVSGPGDLWIRRELPAGQSPSLDLYQNGKQLPEGDYIYELRRLSPMRDSERPILQAGSFVIRNGGFASAFEELERATAPARNASTAPGLIHDKLITAANECIGPLCVAGDDAFPIVRLKGYYNVGILFDDVFDNFSYDRNWLLQANPNLGGPDSFFLQDLDAGTTPFSVFGNSPDYSLVIGSGGKIGLGTAIPAAPLHLYGSATSDAYAGMGPNPASGPAFNFGYGGGSFGRGSAFLNVRPDASATAPNPSLRFLTANVERMIVTNTGDVGLGTSSPSTQLHVRDSGSRGKILAENANGTTTPRELLEIKNNGGAVFILDDTSVVQRWALGTVGSNIVFDNQANAGTEYTFGPTGNMTIAGALTQNSDRDTKRDIVPVQPEEILAKVASLPIATWNRKLDPPSVRHLGPMAQDFAATFGLGEDDRQIATLDMAGVSLASIQALYRMAAQKEEEIAQLRRENADLAARLAALEALVRPPAE